jgi:hypothetical protein
LKLAVIRLKFASIVAAPHAHLKGVEGMRRGCQLMSSPRCTDLE